MPAGSNLSARTTYPSTMPYLTALIYKYEDGSKNYHKIKVRLQSRLSGTVRLSKPIVRHPASDDEFTYVGTFRRQFQGHQQPEPPSPPTSYDEWSKQAPSGWFRTNGDRYYIWYQIPESIVAIERKQLRAQELQARPSIYKHNKPAMGSEKGQ